MCLTLRSDPLAHDRTDVAAMPEAADLVLDPMALVHLLPWSRGRVVLPGDDLAGTGPSTGSGIRQRPPPPWRASRSRVSAAGAGKTQPSR